jgi:hypothetical protein
VLLTGKTHENQRDPYAVAINMASLYLFRAARPTAQTQPDGAPFKLHAAALMGGAIAAEIGRRFWFKEGPRRELGLSVFVGCCFLIVAATKVEAHLGSLPVPVHTQPHGQHAHPSLGSPIQLISK